MAIIISNCVFQCVRIVLCIELASVKIIFAISLSPPAMLYLIKRRSVIHITSMRREISVMTLFRL